ncbi:unnamed protein product [Dibothriocephalus latus]|uniref:Uncharacterized protein n=1 Tax=Dibothriocephalus latus TaxID=60516 RepID=A0A3P7NTP0_DIBLA|nr:unnamed protein product [Dibothriocephalus latus]
MEELWLGDDEEEVMTLVDCLSAECRCIPAITDVSHLYPRLTPHPKRVQQHSVHDSRGPPKQPSADIMEELTPDFAALPFPLTEKAPTTETKEDAREAEEENYSALSMKVASGLLRISVPEMRTKSLQGETSAPVLSLLPTAPASSAPVSREAMDNEVSSPACFSSPTLQTEQQQQQEEQQKQEPKQGEQQDSATSSQTVSDSPSDLDVWVLSKSSSSVEANSGDERATEQATEEEEDETAEEVGLIQPVHDPADGDVTPQQHSCTPLLVSQDEETFVETLPTVSSLQSPDVEDDLSQLAAAAGVNLAAEFAQTPDDDEVEEEDNGREEDDKESGHLLDEIVVEEVEMDVEQLSPIQEVTAHEHLSSREDSLDEDDANLSLPEDFELVPAQEDADSLSSSSTSLPRTSRLLTRPPNERLSTSSQRSTELTAGSVCSDTADESSRDSQSTVVFMGLPLATGPTRFARPGGPESAEVVMTLLPSPPTENKELTEPSVPTSHHLSGLASTPSLLGRSTSSGVYFPQKSRLGKMQALAAGPGVSAPALTQASDLDSKSSSLSEFERLERQMCATSSPEALQGKQSPSPALQTSSSSKTPSSLSEFERLETAMEAATSSSRSSSSDIRPKRSDAGGGGERSSQLSLTEFLRIETECQKEDLGDTAAESVPSPSTYTKIDTIYEDTLAEQACQSLESSRQTDDDLSSSGAGQMSSVPATVAQEAIEGSTCESDSLTQSSLCDSLIPTYSLVDSSSFSFREHQPSANIQYIIREARDVIERGLSRERDSLGEEDSLTSSSDVEDLPGRSSSVELEQHQEPSGQSSLPRGFLRTSQDSLDDILPIQGCEDTSISSSSFSQALHSCPMTDSLEDSGAAMASCSRTSTQPPSGTELSKPAGVIDTHTAFALRDQGESEDVVQEGGEKESKKRQLSSLELRATSDDEALAKRSRTQEGRISSRLGPSMSSGSLHDASVLGLEAAPVSRTDSNLGSTIFDISEEELGVGSGKSNVLPPASLTCSPLRSMTSSQTSEMPEVHEKVEPGTLVETSGLPPISQLTELLTEAPPLESPSATQQKCEPFVFKEVEDDFTVITRQTDVQTTESTASHVAPEDKTEEGK